MNHAWAVRCAAYAASQVILCWSVLAQELPSPAAGSWGSGFWEPTNGPRGATTMSLTRGVSGTLIAATYGGTYRSTNASGEWHRVGPFADVAAAGGTSFFVGSNGQGVRRSTDDGANWTDLPGLTPYVRALVATPDGSVFAGTEVRDPGATAKGEIFFLESGSTTWSRVYPPPGVSSDAVVCLAVDSSGHLLFSTGQGSILHSPDTGKSYTSTSDPQATEDLQVGPDGTAFAAGRRGVFRSTDHGLSWSQFNAGLTDTLVYALAVRDGGNIVAGTASGVFGSTDVGLTWELRSDAVTGIRSLLWVTDGELLAGTVAGISRSTDGGRTWRNFNYGLGSDYVIALGVDPRGRLFAGVAGWGVYRSGDRGESWSPPLTGTGRWPTWFCFKDSLLCFAAFSDSGVYRSTDGGQTWSPANNGVERRSARTVGVTGSGAIILGTWGGVYRSTDDGETWTHRETGTDTVVTAFARTATGQLLLGATGAVLLSIDDGLTWLPSRWGLPPGQVWGLVQGGLGLFFAGLDNGGVYRSTDNGASWVQCGSGPASGIYVYGMDANTRGHLYVAAYQGVIRSTDVGDSWEALGADLPISSTTSIALDQEGFVYAGTAGAGIWKSTSSTLVSVSAEQSPVPEAALYGNYPNPFNGTTRIVFRLPGGFKGVARLSVFDLLGRRVAVPAEGRLQAGVHEVTFSGDGLASGAYFYRLEAGGAILTRTMLHIR